MDLKTNMFTGLGMSIDLETMMEGDSEEMGMDLGVKKFELKPEYFIAGSTIRITTAVKKAGEALKAHAPVILSAAGEVTAVKNGGAAVVTTGIYGITVDSAVAGKDAVIYLTGEFFSDALELETGVTAKDVEIPLRNIGIFLK